MTSVVVSSTVDTLVIPGDVNRKLVTITNVDPSITIYLRNVRKIVGTTSSTNFSYALLATQTYLGRLGIEGVDATQATFFAIAASGSPTLGVEATQR